MKLSFANWIRLVVIAGVGDIYVFYVENVLSWKRDAKNSR